jgi:hypothetical protein
VLSQGFAWVPAVVVRTAIIDKAVGGWSGMLRLFLEDLLLGAEGLSTAGLPLMIGERCVAIRATVSNILADGAGIDFHSLVGMLHF